MATQKSFTLFCMTILPEIRCSLNLFVVYFAIKAHVFFHILPEYLNNGSDHCIWSPDLSPSPGNPSLLPRMSEIYLSLLHGEPSEILPVSSDLPDPESAGSEKVLLPYSTSIPESYLTHLRSSFQRQYGHLSVHYPYIFPFIFQKYSQTHLDVAGFITVDQFRTEMIVLQHFQNLILMFCSESFHRDTQFNCCTSVCRYKLVVF